MQYQACGSVESLGFLLLPIRRKLKKRKKEKSSLEDGAEGSRGRRGEERSGGGNMLLRTYVSYLYAYYS